MNTTGLSQLLICLSLLGPIVAPAASACQADPTAAFQDDFKRPDPRWPLDGTAVFAANGQLIVKPDPGAFLSPTVDGPRFRGATFCLDVQTPADLNPADPDGGGLIFWRVDNRNYFLALVYPDGSYLLTRLAGGSWNNLSRKEKFAKLNAGPGAVNEIRIAALNGRLTLYLNGTNAFEAPAQPPVEGGQVGVFASSPKDRANEWRFRNLTVTGVADPAGRYAVSGTAPGSNPYRGTITVEKAGRAYRVTRSVDGRTVEGLGLLQGDTFSVSYGVTEPERSAIGVYVVAEQGWTGAVTMVASGAADDKVASETWLRN